MSLVVTCKDLDRIQGVTAAVSLEVKRNASGIPPKPEVPVRPVRPPGGQQVGAESRQGQRRTGKRRPPPGHVEEVATLAQHAAPRRCGRLHAEAQEGYGGL